MTGICMVRCNNDASKFPIIKCANSSANDFIDAGPFGGCVPVQMVGAGGAAGNGTAVAKRASVFNA